MKLKWRPVHRRLGMMLILPFLGWAATGLFFFIKPGYQKAYAPLPIKKLSLADTSPIQPADDWLEYRVVRTVLGVHLLVKTTEGRLHLDGTTLKPLPQPESDGVRALMEDAFVVDPDRYGAIDKIDGLTATTNTDVRITLNWQSLSLYQYGRDTGFIDTMYDIHYLKWTGIEAVDRILGVAGLILLCLMALTGVILLRTSQP